MTTPPLYFVNPHPNRGQRGGHKGLLYDRFFHGYILPACNKKEANKNRNPELDWINNISGTCGDTQALKQSAIRQQRLAKTLGGESICFKTDWHFVTGLGNPHPVENGFSWHPTLGTPYVPGAAVKGLIRSWIEMWCDTPPKELIQWFGSEQKAQAEQAGEFIFFDALPLKPPTLAADIMTPHMGQWYAQGNTIKNVDNEPEKVPADWHSPKPIPFLVVKKAVFQFTIVPRTAAAKGSLDSLMEALTSALDYLGAGAKTAVGYGRMERDKESEEEVKKQQHQDRLNALAPEERTIAEITHALDNDPDKTKVVAGGDVANRLNGALQQAHNWPQASRIQLAELAERFYGQHTSWGKRDKKQHRKDLIRTLKGT